MFTFPNNDNNITGNVYRVVGADRWVEKTEDDLKHRTVVRESNQESEDSPESLQLMCISESNRS